MRSPKKKQSAGGFSLIELMIVILLLGVIMGAVFGQIDLVQKRFRAEETKVDVFQTSREFMEEMTRDLHQAGFPNLKMYQPGLYNISTSDKIAVGLVYISPTKVRFEADVDGDGDVDAISYWLDVDTTKAGNQNCPCIRRSQVTKVNGTAPNAQVEDYRTQVENITVNPNVPVFTAFDNKGNLVNIAAGLTRNQFDPNSVNFGADPVNTVWTLHIAMTVQGITADIQTGQRPFSALTSSVQLRNTSY